MTDSGFQAASSYRDEIVRTITPVRPLPSPWRRVRLLLPFGLLVAITGPLLSGPRGDLEAYTPLVSWGLTAGQSLLGLWLLALGFREAVPGRNVSRRALTIASALTALVVLGITFLTNAASATVVPLGRELQYWAECVAGPMVIGAPFMVVATLMAARAFPTRPSIAGALCGMSAGILTDAGWRLSCWISEPTHIISSHGLAVIGLAATGALLAVVADARRWRRFAAGRSVDANRPGRSDGGS